MSAQIPFDCILYANIIVSCSGAQGEYAGLRAIRAYHEHNGNGHRKVHSSCICALLFFFLPPNLCCKCSSIVVVLEYGFETWACHCIVSLDETLFYLAALHPPKMVTGDRLLVVAFNALCILSSSDGLASNIICLLYTSPSPRDA